jgi:amino acid permease
MRYLLNVTFLVAPIGLKELGIQTFSVAMIYSVMINLFTTWLQLNAERRFRDGNPRISSIRELTEHCYSNPINLVYLALKIISCITFLIVFNIYLGNETDQILCHTMKSY